MKVDEEVKADEELGGQKQATDYGQAFKVSYKMQLVPQEASYNLVIDSQVPVQMLIL